MLSTQIPLTIAVIVGLSAMTVSPAFAETIPETNPTADVVETIPNVTDAPATSVPVVGEPSTLATSEIDAGGSEPEIGLTEVATENPIADLPRSSEVAAPEVEAPTDSGSPAGELKLYTADFTAPVAEGEPGWTSCWVSEVNRTDVSQIDPYDQRTWPVYVTLSEGQPGYMPHGGASDEGRNIWIQVERDDPRVLGASEDGTSWDIFSPGCYPSLVFPTWSASASILDSAGRVTNSVKQDAVPGARVAVQTSFEVKFPALRAVTGLDGQPSTDWYQGSNSFRFTAATVNGSVFGDLFRPQDLIVNCDGADGTFAPGDAVTIICVTTGDVPDVTFDEFRRAIFNASGDGATVPFDTRISYESRYVDTGDPSRNGQWGLNDELFADFASFQVSPAQEWLPTARDQKFRVKVTETLTVTPDGLVNGAEWGQGNVDELDTYLTNVPAGGTVTAEGNLEFTSAQIGDYAFNYYLRDPDTAIRSQEATGNIEVYADPLVVVTAPPVAAEPPVIDPPIVAPAVTLASTGYQGGPVMGGALALLLSGLVAMALSRRSRRSITEGAWS